MSTNLHIPEASPVIAPPFTLETATQKVRAAEDAWNSRDPDRVALAYTEDSVWRNRSEFVVGRDRIRQFLAGKWAPRTRLPAREGPVGLHRRIGSACDSSTSGTTTTGRWYRSYGNELWEFDERGLMRRREASINDVPIAEQDRRFHWPLPGPRPADHPGIPEVQ